MESDLHYAAQNGQLQVLGQLLAEGANVNAADAHGYTPLHVAAAGGHTRVVQVLLAAGANVDSVNIYGNTPLHSAAATGRLEAVKLLLEAGANVNVADAGGRTPLHAAAERGHTKIMQLLLAAGANINAVTKCGKAPLHSATSSSSSLHSATCCCEMVQLLLRQGANPQLRFQGRTALDGPASNGYTDIVQVLLEAWGQPVIAAADLIQAAKVAAMRRHKYQQGNKATFARLAKELQRLHPAELHKLFEGHQSVSPAAAVAGVLDAWASDVSSLDEQRAAVRKREEDVASEKQAVQQLIVGIAGVAKQAHQHQRLQ